MHGDHSDQASPDAALPSASQVLEGSDASDGQLREGMGGGWKQKGKVSRPIDPFPYCYRFPTAGRGDAIFKNLKIFNTMQMYAINLLQ